MSFLEAIHTTFIQKYFVFSGRASRSEFWWFKLGYYIALCMIGLLVFILPLEMSSPVSIAIFVIVIVTGQTAIMIPFIAVSTRRLHDKNMSGYWVIILLVPLLMQFLIFFPRASSAAYLIIEIANIFYIGDLALHILFMFKGTEGNNKYGTDPLQP